MLKTVFKEIAIILLLILAILILLAILFYDYMPNSKVVPAKVEEYVLAEDVKLELEKELNNANSEEIIKTYQLDAIDLEHYERTREYNKGKVNPFAQYNTGTTGETSTGTSNGGQTGTGNSNSSGETTNSNNSDNETTGTSNNNQSTGTFLNTVGK